MEDDLKNILIFYLVSLCRSGYSRWLEPWPMNHEPYKWTSCSNLQNYLSCTFEVVFHLQKYLRSYSFYKSVLVFQRTMSGSLPFAKIFKSSLICQKLRLSFICQIEKNVCQAIEVVFHLPKYLQKYLRSSSLYKNIWGHLPFKNIFEVVFHLQK